VQFRGADDSLHPIAGRIEGARSMAKARLNGGHSARARSSCGVTRGKAGSIRGGEVAHPPSHSFHNRHFVLGQVKDLINQGVDLALQGSGLVLEMLSICLAL